MTLFRGYIPRLTSTGSIYEAMYPRTKPMSFKKDFKMKKLATLMHHLLFSENGTTSIEYALVASLIFLAIVGAVIQLGGGVMRMYQLVASCIPR